MKMRIFIIKNGFVDVRNKMEVIGCQVRAVR